MNPAWLFHTSMNSPSTEALELVTHAATHSNDTMKRVDKFKQLLEIQENISGGPDLVSPTRELMKEGKITKISARSGDHQERYLFLVRNWQQADLCGIPECVSVGA